MLKSIRICRLSGWILRKKALFYPYEPKIRPVQNRKRNLPIKLLFFALSGAAVGRLIALDAGLAPLPGLAVLSFAAVTGAAFSGRLAARNQLYFLGLAAFIPVILADYAVGLTTAAAGFTLGAVAALPVQTIGMRDRQIFALGGVGVLLGGYWGGTAAMLSFWANLAIPLLALPGALAIFARSFRAPRWVRRMMTATVGVTALLILAIGPVSLRQPGYYLPEIDSGGRCYLARHTDDAGKTEIRILDAADRVRFRFPADYVRHFAMALPALLQPDDCANILVLAEAPSAIPEFFAGFERVGAVDMLIAGPRFGRLSGAERSKKIRELSWRPHRLKPAGDAGPYQLIFISELPASTTAAQRRLLLELSRRLAPGGVIVLPDGGFELGFLPVSARLPGGNFRAFAAAGTQLPGDDLAKLEERLKDVTMPGAEIMPEGILTELYTWETQISQAESPLPPAAAATAAPWRGMLPALSPWAAAAAALGLYLALRMWLSRYPAGCRNFTAAETGAAAALITLGSVGVLAEYSLLDGYSEKALIGLAALLFVRQGDGAFQLRASFALVVGAALLAWCAVVRPDWANQAIPPLLAATLYFATLPGHADAPRRAALGAFGGMAAGGLLYALIAAYAAPAALPALLAGFMLLLPRHLRI
jgi:hypothetical protein